MSSLAEYQSEIRDVSKLSPKEIEKVEKIVSSIDIFDSQSVIEYGYGAQSEIAEFSDTILSQIRAKDTGYVGEILTDLMVKVKDVDVDGITGEKGFFGKLFSSASKQVIRFTSKYSKVSVEIDKIVDTLEQTKMSLLKDITLLDNLYDKNLDYMNELEAYIYAGEQKVKELNDTVIPEAKKKAKESGVADDAQKANDIVKLANKFEKKIHDLRLSRTVSIQSCPQIRLVQNNDEQLVDKIQSSIVNTIPLWKNQIVIAITIMKQQGALELQKEVSATTNELLAKNSELLKEGTIETAKETERGIVDIETLQKVNQDLIETIEESIRIQEEGKARRLEAEKELVILENQLKQKLIDAKKE
jgi:uncharacterized protein YaaN involved in tellurite resistance